MQFLLSKPLEIEGESQIEEQFEVPDASTSQVSGYDIVIKAEAGLMHIYILQY